MINVFLLLTDLSFKAVDYYKTSKIPFVKYCTHNMIVYLKDLVYSKLFQFIPIHLSLFTSQKIVFRRGS